MSLCLTRAKFKRIKDKVHNLIPMAKCSGPASESLYWTPYLDWHRWVLFLFLVIDFSRTSDIIINYEVRESLLRAPRKGCVTLKRETLEKTAPSPSGCGRGWICCLELLWLLVIMKDPAWEQSGTEIKDESRRWNCLGPWWCCWVIETDNIGFYFCLNFLLCKIVSVLMVWAILNQSYIFFSCWKCSK